MVKLENILIAIFGIISVVFFLLMLMIGGLFGSPDSFLFREISYIISPYSSASDINMRLYQLYNYYLIFFAYILCLRMKSSYAKLGAVYLIVSGFIGIVLLHYPMDPHGKSGSAIASMHMAVVLFMSVYVAIALILLAFAFKRSAHLHWLANFSMGASALLMVAGFASGVFAYFSMSEYVGLTQKFPIALFLIWIVLTGCGMIHSDGRVKHYLWKSSRK